MAPDATRSSPKRTRFNDDVEEITDSTTTRNAPDTPFTVAKRHLRTTTASLHPETVTIIDKYHLEFIKHKSFILHKKKLLLSTEHDNDALPRSTRLKFKLNPSKEIAELPEFLELQQETLTVVQELQLKLKKQVIKHLKLEIKAKEENLKKLFADAIHTIIKVLLIELRLDDTLLHKKVNLTVDHLRQDLLKYSGLSHVEFFQLYIANHNLEDMPVYNLHQVVNSQGEFTLAPVVENKDKIIFTTLQNIFVTTWDIYIVQKEKNETSLAVKKFHDENLQSKSNEDVNMILENENSVDIKTLKTLIKTETSHQHQKLLREFKDMKKLLSHPPKKSQTGRARNDPSKNKQRASTPKKDTTDTSTERGRRKEKSKNTKGRAGESAKDGNAETTSKGTSKNKKNSKKSGGRTRRGKSRERRQSI